MQYDDLELDQTVIDNDENLQDSQIKVPTAELESSSSSDKTGIDIPAFNADDIWLD